MKYLGIDFGTKRVGIAISDEEGKIAFPNEVLPNDSGLLQNVIKICDGNLIGAVVIGESNDFAGNPNPIMKDVKKFIKGLEKKIKAPIIFEPEFLSSVQASRIQGETKKLDASAAAIILQSFLDKNNSKQKKTEPKIPYDDFAKVEIKVGKILKADKISDTDKLLKLTVDFGEERTRQIVSGIARYFPDPEVLVGKQCLFVTNLEPRVILGEESNGMILALSTINGSFSLLEPNSMIPIGTRVK